MATYINPASARYKKDTLIFNLSEQMFQVTDDSIARGYDVGFIFSDFSIYIELDPGLKFGVLDHSTMETYGPYDSILKIVQKHIFGKYDNIISYFSENIKFDDEIGAYGIKLPGFYYYRGSFDLGSNLPDATKRLKALLPPIDQKFVYSLQAKTFFSEGSIEIFLNRLNVMFNENNFTEAFKESDFYDIGVVSRASGTAIEQSNGNRFFIVNTSCRRHATYIIPKITTSGFINISSGSSNCDYVIDEYISNEEQIVETNEDKVEYLLDILGQNQTEKTLEYKNLSLFSDIKLVLFPSNSTRIGYYFVRLTDETIKIIEFDAFTRTFVVFDESKAIEISELIDNGVVSVNQGTVSLIYNGEDFSASGSPTLKMSINNFRWAIYKEDNQVLNEDGNKYSFKFAKNLLQTIFSGGQNVS